MSPSDDWRSYDSVAEAYARVRVAQHALLARDLVDAVAPPFGGRVLDVGAGTGTAAVAAAAAVGPAGFSVGLDPSVPLLELGRDRAAVALVAGRAPGLPFARDCFDAVVANLVVTHFERYDVALADMVGVLRPGGRLAVSAWGSPEDVPPVDDPEERQAFDVWSRVAAGFVDIAALDEASRTGAPWEGWFSDPAHLRGALGDAGLRRVELRPRAYRYRLSHEDWLTARDTGFRGRYLHREAGDAAWTRFRGEVLKALHDAVPDPLDCLDEALIVVASKPRR